MACPLRWITPTGRNLFKSVGMREGRLTRRPNPRTRTIWWRPPIRSLRRVPAATGNGAKSRDSRTAASRLPEHPRAETFSPHRLFHLPHPPAPPRSPSPYLEAEEIERSLIGGPIQHSAAY